MSDEEIAERLAGLPGWEQNGHTIERTFRHTYHECVHLAMYVAAKAREVGHRLTAKDFDLAHHIDAIATAHGAEPA
ncbi:4a-hydroxytetrahydrobiopterin dehydratase [Streptosporangium sp. NPDC049376]|uniref:4a-hydroxytetrahydrobiopterin dehydratase n=1 Tax=Streptosporangium sp. NPDC049376 TaxID=3366192 RepID=UPI0037AD66D2